MVSLAGLSFLAGAAEQHTNAKAAEYEQAGKEKIEQMRLDRLDKQARFAAAATTVSEQATIAAHTNINGLDVTPWLDKPTMAAHMKLASGDRRKAVKPLFFNKIAIPMMQDKKYINNTQALYDDMQPVLKASGTAGESSVKNDVNGVATYSSPWITNLASYIATYKGDKEDPRLNAMVNAIVDHTSGALRVAPEIARNWVFERGNDSKIVLKDNGVNWGTEQIEDHAKFEARNDHFINRSKEKYKSRYVTRGTQAEFGPLVHKNNRKDAEGKVKMVENTIKAYDRVLDLKQGVNIGPVTTFWTTIMNTIQKETKGLAALVGRDADELIQMLPKGLKKYSRSFANINEADREFLYLAADMARGRGLADKSKMANDDIKRAMEVLRVSADIKDFQRKIIRIKAEAIYDNSIDRTRLELNSFVGNAYDKILRKERLGEERRDQIARLERKLIEDWEAADPSESDAGERATKEDDPLTLSSTD